MFLFIINRNYWYVSAKNKIIRIPIYEDITVEEGHPNNILPLDQYNKLGYDMTWRSKRQRILFVPDYSFLINKNISPELIQKATLHIFAKNSIPYNSIGINIYSILDTWDPYDTSWSNQPLNVDYYYQKKISGASGEKTIGLTNRFISDYRNSYNDMPANGFELRFANENIRPILFWSKDCDLYNPPCESNVKPYIEIEYKDNSVPTQPIVLAPSNEFKTNGKDISFVWLPANDPDGDTLEYRVVIAKDSAFTEIYKQSSWFTSNNIKLTIGKEGGFYWRIEVKDQYNNKNFSVANIILVDKTPPVVPIMYSVANIISTEKIKIKWFLPVWQEDDSEIKYQLLIKDYKAKTEVITDWQSNLFYDLSVEDAHEYKVCVRNKDSLDNISDWSKCINFKVDNKTPHIEYLKLNKQFINNLRDSVFIQFKANDANYKFSEIRIYNSFRNLIYKVSKNSEYISIHWPINKNLLAEGIYYVLGVAYDQSNHISQSKILPLYIDRTSPKINIFIKGLKSNNFLNTNRVNIFTSTNETVTCTLYINNKVYQKFKNVIHKTVFLKDGKKTLLLKCTDNAGNASVSKKVIYVDTTPPIRPVLSIKRDDTKHYIQVKCEKGSLVNIFVWGIQFKTFLCKNIWNKIPINVIPNILYIFNAQATDKAGNRSELSSSTYRFHEVPFAKTKLPTNQPGEPSCFIKVNVTTQQQNTYCSGKQLKVLNSKASRNKYGITYYINVSVPSRVKIKLVKVKCLPKSIFNPLTWFKCVEKKYYTHYFTAPINYIAKQEYKVSQVRKNVILLSKNSSKTFNTEKVQVLGFLNLKEYRLTAINIINELISVKYSVPSPQKAKTYFKWIFQDTNVLASQWHGNTAFQHPHTGIDFAVFNKKILVPQDGIIVSAGYNRITKCFAGGYYIGIKHPNGMYTYYFHLKGLNNKHKNETVKTREYLATTGNSGKYQCKSLSPHLHFEIRTCGLPKCHINPVPYIDIDWSKIRTATYNKYFERLKGDNPHPAY